MLKFNKMEVVMDTSKVERVAKLISSLLEKIRQYNGEIDKANRLLSKQIRLKKEAGVTYKHGQLIGYDPAAKKSDRQVTVVIPKHEDNKNGEKKND